MKDPKLNEKEVSILWATKDWKNYIVDTGGPSRLAGIKFKVTLTQLILAQDTPITVGYERGEVFTAYVDSFNKKTNMYKVFVMCGVGRDDKYAFLDVPRNDLRVMFVSDSMHNMLGKGW